MNAGAPDSLVGKTVGSYRIVGKLGSGGMGAVYVAEHPFLGKRAAIKVVLPELSQSPEHIARFHGEARAAAQLRHPAFVNVFDFGQLPDGSAFLAMDLLEGKSLRTVQENDERLPLPVALRIARQIAAGMAVAHESGIVHRDLKPDNIFLEVNPADRQTVLVKILDFGVAKLVQRDDAPPITQSGAMLGTPVYMSPEQCRGEGGVDPRSDIYAWGCLLFTMLTGGPPFERLDGYAAVITAHLFKSPPRLRDREPSVPPALDDLVAACLAKVREERPPSMAALVRAVDQIGAALGLGSLVQGPQLGEVGIELAPEPARPRPMPHPERRSAPASDAPKTALTAPLNPDRGPSVLAVEQIRKPPGRVGLWTVASFAAGAAIFVFAVRELQQEAPAPTPTPARIETAAPAPPAVPAPPAAEPVPVKPPATYRLEIRSAPAGARVVDAASGKLLGQTPLSLRYPQGEGPRRIMLSKPGFTPHSALVAKDKDDALEVSLTRAKRRPGRAVAPAPAEDPEDRRKL